MLHFPQEQPLINAGQPDSRLLPRAKITVWIQARQEPKAQQQRSQEVEVVSGGCVGRRELSAPCSVHPWGTTQPWTLGSLTHPHAPPRPLPQIKVLVPTMETLQKSVLPATSQSGPCCTTPPPRSPSQSPHFAGRDQRPHGASGLGATL